MPSCCALHHPGPLRTSGHVALAVASSGIAALLLEGGRTAHSQFKIPIPIQRDSLCRIDADSELAHLLRAARLVVWDEAPMMHRCGYVAVHRQLFVDCMSLCLGRGVWGSVLQSVL